MSGIALKECSHGLSRIFRFTDYSLFAMLLRNDMRAKFRHSILGVLWLFIPPVSILLVYIYMFSFVFKLNWPEHNFKSSWGFSLIIYIGITIYSAFCDCVMGSIGILTGRTSMLKRVPFPFELLPVSLVCVNMLISAFVLWLLFLLSLMTGGEGSWTALLYFPLIYLPFTLLSFGACWIVAATAVFFQDLGNLAAVVLRLIFFASPVFYSLSMIPEKFVWILKLNPLTPVICSLRCIFLQNTRPDLQEILYLWIIGTLTCCFGYMYFQRLRRRFADVV